MYKNIFLICFILQYGGGQYFSVTNNYEYTKAMFYWKQMHYNINGVNYTKDTQKQFIQDGVYFKEEIDDSEMFFTQYNNVPVGFEFHKYTRVFITVPRRRFGIPSTLNVIDDLRSTRTPALKPYPDANSIKSFVSVYRPRTDVKCERLWVVDTGLLEVPNNRRQVKPPEIIVFDLKTDKELLRYQLKDNVLVNGTTSGLISITVDVTDSCDDAYAYITDMATGGIIVFSLKQKDSWRFSHPTFNYDPGASDFKVENQKIDWKDGIFSIALSEPDSKGVRKAYYHPLVATQEFSITTDVLKDKNGDIEKNFKLEGVRGAWSQSGSHGYHNKTRTLFFANVAQDAILCWNTDKPLTPKNTALVAQNHDWLIYISDLKVINNDVIVLVNRMPTFVYSKLNPANYNFHILWAPVAKLINGTVCDVNYKPARNKNTTN